MTGGPVEVKLTSSTHPASCPLLPLAFLAYVHRSSLLPAVMLKVCGCQSTSPEMLVNCNAPTYTLKKSALVSDDTFHQKVTIPGPMTVVCSTDCPLSDMAPLCAASIP